MAFLRECPCQRRVAAAVRVGIDVLPMCFHIQLRKAATVQAGRRHLELFRKVDLA